MNAGLQLFLVISNQHRASQTYVDSDNGLINCEKDAMKELNSVEVDAVSGAGVLNDVGAALGAASIVAGGLAAVPTPASGALAGFAVLTGFMGAGMSWLDSRVVYVR